MMKTKISLTLTAMVLASAGNMTTATAQPLVSIPDAEGCVAYIIEPVVVDDDFDVLEYDILRTTVFVFLETQVWSTAREGLLTGFSCDPLEELLCTVGNMTIRAECIEPDDVDVDIDPLTRHVRIDIVRFY